MKLIALQAYPDHFPRFPIAHADMCSHCSDEPYEDDHNGCSYMSASNQDWSQLSAARVREFSMFSEFTRCPYYSQKDPDAADIVYTRKIHDSVFTEIGAEEIYHREKLVKRDERSLWGNGLSPERSVISIASHKRLKETPVQQKARELVEELTQELNSYKFKGYPIDLPKIPIQNDRICLTCANVKLDFDSEVSADVCLEMSSSGGTYRALSKKQQDTFLSIRGNVRCPFYI